jgi:diguanylate cyclase (GGDEF)-like protein
MLIVVAGPGVGKHLPIDDRAVEVGRLPGCDLSINSASVSRRHARFEQRGDEYFVVDLESKNGTRVNGKPVREHHLCDGDRITLGKAVIRFAESSGTEVRYLRELYEASATDALTGLANRRRFEEVLRAEATNARIHRTPLALLMMDIDHFKALNDQHGHMAGDLVLQAVARALQNRVREADIVCRLGGEEFAVLCPRTSGRQAQDLAERIRAEVASLVVEFDGRRLRVTVSAGVAVQDPDMISDPESLYERADKLLYRAKRGGRNRVSAAR